MDLQKISVTTLAIYFYSAHLDDKGKHICDHSLLPAHVHKVPHKNGVKARDQGTGHPIRKITVTNKYCNALQNTKTCFPQKHRYTVGESL